MQLKIFKKDVTYFSVCVIFSQMDPKWATEFPYCRVSERITDWRAGRGLVWVPFLPTDINMFFLFSQCGDHRSEVGDVHIDMASKWHGYGSWELPVFFYYAKLLLTRRGCHHHTESMKQKTVKKTNKQQEECQCLGSKDWQDVTIRMQ